MFLDLQNSQLMEIVNTFNQLNPDFQNFIINQLKQLLEMNHNYLPEGDIPKEKAKGK
jgi:hypothetical protein